MKFLIIVAIFVALVFLESGGGPSPPGVKADIRPAWLR